MKRLSMLAIFALLFSCEFSKPTSPVTFPKLISEGMVVQRLKPIAIWGKGIPGEKVRASLAGAIGSTKVLEDSTWTIELPPIPAGGPFVLEVNTQTIQDVWVGDVWVAGGQSNMEWPLKSGVIGAEAEFENADFPQIRFFKVSNDYSPVEKSDVSGGSWKVANEENLPDFSAVAWFFAKRNHQDFKFPVGIIESNWGGTPAEGWTEAKVLAKIESRSYTEESRDVVENTSKWKEIILENEKRREMRDILVRRPDSLMAGEVASLNYPEPGWRSIRLPDNNPLEHIAWVRKKFNLGNLSQVTLHLPHLNQMAFLYVNGVQVFHKDWGVDMPELEIPKELLRQGQNVLTVRVINTWNNRPEIGKKENMYLLQDGKKISLEGAWSYANSIVEPLLPEVNFYNWKPGFMFNAMIAPLFRYPIKGVIWYQGESNAGRHTEYRELFSTMIQNWRSRWDIGDFPFLYVQLANYMERKEVQPESNWAYLREAQTQVLDLPLTGMAVTIDIGEAGDIHPRNKKDVGERLWFQARKVGFGEQILASGPVVENAEVTGNEVVITFSEVGVGLKLTDGDEVYGFILEDAEGEFKVAPAKISGVNQVTLTIPDGLVPVGVRYAWADNPAVNLVNEINLPALPFRIEL
ncbi:MAG: sialate O-acetylesterase [Algoriphagus sp. 32-45-6]|nr:MAG: sialate O-acetylesterase [Algoriphagus sp. 32-45-6]